VFSRLGNKGFVTGHLPRQVRLTEDVIMWPHDIMLIRTARSALLDTRDIVCAHEYSRVPYSKRQSVIHSGNGSISVKIIISLNAT
jgi:hypothetical protein